MDMTHQNESAREGLFKCKYFTFNNSDEEVLRKHLHCEHTLKCTICNSTFRDSNERTNHIKVVHENSYTKNKKIQ